MSAKPSASSCEVSALAYYNDEQLYRYFDKAIRIEADKKIVQLRKEIDYLYAKEMKKIKEDLTIKKDLQLSKDMRDLQIEYQDQINQIGVGFDEKLIKERSFMINIIFQTVLAKLGDFIQTEDYDQLIIDKLAKMEDFIKNKKVIFKVSKNDQRIKKVIKKTITTSYEVEISNEIHLGGFIVEIPAEYIEVDETIDTNLKERKEWFFKNSKLFIRT